MPLSNLLTDLIDNFGDPNFLWQVAAVVFCGVLGWWLARVLRNAVVAHRSRAAPPPIGPGSFARVLSPVLTLVFLVIARYAMATFMKVPMLKVAVPLAGSYALIRVFFYIMRKVFGRRGPLGAAFVTFEKAFATMVWAGVALYILGWWPELVDFLENTVVPLGKNRVSIAVILQAAVSVVVLLMLALWAGAALEERLLGVAGIHMSLRVVMARMGRTVMIVVAVLLSLSMVGIDLTVLSVFGGALGVGLGLGMQKIASNYVSGFVILLERSLAIGDMISVDKFSGKVARINTRYTVLQGLDGVETVLPNEMLISGPVQNQSLSTRMVRYSTQITVSHDSDLDVVIPLLEQLPVGVPRVLEQPGPGVGLNRFTPDGYELDLGWWVADPENGRGGVASEINKKVYALAKAGEIKLAFPGRERLEMESQILSHLAERSPT